MSQSESSRLANLMRKSCMNDQMLQQVNRLNTDECLPCERVNLSGAFIGNTISSPVPQSSSKLQSNILKCNYSVIGPRFGTRESIRIARLEQKVFDASTDPTNPDTRFSLYRRPFIEICPPIPQFYYTAGQPVLQGKNCALPNKPDNPVLPG